MNIINSCLDDLIRNKTASSLTSQEGTVLSRVASYYILIHTTIYIYS